MICQCTNLIKIDVKRIQDNENYIHHANVINDLNSNH